MATLSGFAKNQAAETSRSNLRIGFVAQVILQAGVVPRYAKALEKPRCFEPYKEGETTDDTKTKSMTKTKAVTGKDHSDFFPCVWIQIVPDTVITLNSRYKGSFLSLETPTQKNPRTQKEHGRFALNYMSRELDEMVGKKVWVHIAWARLTEEFGGDLTLLGDDSNDELSVVITLLKNKRAATDLVKKLRDEEIDTDSLCLARGYPVQEVRDALRSAAAKGKGKDSKATAPSLTAIGPKTTTNFVSIDRFLTDDVIKFLQQNYNSADGDIAAVSESCGAETGDIAIALNKPEYFRDLMEATGLGEQEALVKVAQDTGLADVKDLAIFLDIPEPAF